MKLDQETIVKHQFWFLLGGYFLVWLIAVLCLKFIAPGAIEEFKKGYDGAASGVKSAQSNPVNTTLFLPPWQKEARLFNDHKTVIWKDAWDYQADMYDWPEEWRTKYDMTRPQAPLSSDDRNDYRERLYFNQIGNLRNNAPRWINPVELKGSFDNVFKPMTKADWREIPTKEEVWLAQEDFWVKRELFVVIWDAMVRRALMAEEAFDDKKEAMPQDVEARLRYRNQNWEITLLIRKNSDGYSVIGGDSTIKNIHPSRRPQPLMSAKGEGIKFIVAQDNARSGFEVRGEPVPWNETRNFSAENYPKPLEGIKWSKEAIKVHPIFVSQGFDHTNSPIRRLNAIELPKQDCRTFVWPLQANQMLMQLDAAPADANQSAPDATNPSGATPAPTEGGAPEGGSGGMASGSGAFREMAMRQGGGMGGMRGRQSGPTGNKTPNNEIERNRYLQPPGADTKNLPSRHLPLALQLIVEQEHMHDVLLALANSRLRFQLTQVEFRHVKDYVPQSTGDKKESTDSTDGQYFMGGMPTGMGGGSSVMMQQMRQQMQQRTQQGGGGMDPRNNPQMQQQMQMQRQATTGRGSAMGSGAGMMMMQQPPMRGGATKPMISLAPSGIRPTGGRLPTTTTANDSKQPEGPQHDDNLVEVTIYGIATLYRAPDAPPAAEQSGQSTTPAAQPGQQAPVPATQPKDSTTPAPAPSATTTPANSATPSAESKQTKDAKTETKQSSDAKTPAPKPTDNAGKQPPAPPTPPADGKK